MILAPPTKLTFPLSSKLFASQLKGITVTPSGKSTGISSLPRCHVWCLHRIFNSAHLYAVGGQVAGRGSHRTKQNKEISNIRVWSAPEARLNENLHFHPTSHLLFYDIPLIKQLSSVHQMRAIWTQLPTDFMITSFIYKKSPSEWPAKANCVLCGGHIRETQQVALQPGLQKREPF